MIEEYPELFNPVTLWQMVKAAKLCSKDTFAEHLGVDPRTIGNWQSGNHTPGRSVQRLAAELKIKWQNERILPLN